MGINTQPSGATSLSQVINGPDAPNVFQRTAAKYLSVGLLGDSITAQTFNSNGFVSGATADDEFLSNYGWPTWWAFKSKARLRFTMYAVAGSTSKDVVQQQLDPAIAARHDLYTLAPIGINDSKTGYNLNGDQSVAYINTIVEAVVNIGAKILLGTPTPSKNFASSSDRFSKIMAGMKALQAKYPGQVLLAEFHAAFSDPSSTAGDAFQTDFDTLSYDRASGEAVHPSNWGASLEGFIADEATEKLTLPYKYAKANGDLNNKLANPRMGGSDGAAPSNVAGGTNSVAPTSWVHNKAGAMNYAAYKGRRQGLRHVVGLNYPIGSRISPDVYTGLDYLVLTDATTGATPPHLSPAVSINTTTSATSATGATTLTLTSVTGFLRNQTLTVALTGGGGTLTTRALGVAGSVVTIADPIPAGNTVANGAAVTLTSVLGGAPGVQVKPDASGPVYVAIEADPRGAIITPEEETIIDLSSTGVAAGDYQSIVQTVNAVDKGLVGREVNAGIHMRVLGTAWAGSFLWLRELDAGGAKIKDHVGMGLNYLFGTSVAPYAFPHRNVEGVIPIRPFVVNPNTVNISFTVRSYAPIGMPTRLAFRDAFIE